VQGTLVSTLAPVSRVHSIVFLFLYTSVCCTGQKVTRSYTPVLF